MYATTLVFGGDFEPPPLQIQFTDPVNRDFTLIQTLPPECVKPCFNCSLCQQALLSEKQDEVYEPRALREAHELAENVRAWFAMSRQKERAFQLRVKNEYLGFLAREKTRYHKTGKWL